MNTTDVEFTTEYCLHCYGDKLVLVGSTRELGHWFPTSAPVTHVQEGSHYVMVKMPSDSTVEFKWAVLDQGKPKSTTLIVY